MKKSIAAVLIALLVVGGVSWAYHASGQRFGKASSPQQKDTVFVNTTDLAKDVIGYEGTTPLLIKLVEGRIVSIEALPNDETPGFFRRVKNSALFTAPLGKTVSEALELKLDAVSGATFSSKAVIENLRRGLRSVSE